MQSTIDMMSERSRIRKICYTWGYGGKQYADLLDTLNFLKKRHNQHNQIILVVDIRAYPHCSWDRGFSIENLEKLSEDIRIRYYHAKQLGNFNKQMTMRFWSDICDHSTELSELVKYNIILLLCSEKYAITSVMQVNCHRYFIAEYLKIVYNYEVRHL